jgi:D-sedoheptulose 7-phosphate isomerase
MSLVNDYLTELEATIHNLSRVEIEAVVEALLENLRAGKQVFIIGNGGSAATASHMMNDLNKYTLVEGQPRFRALALTDNVPLMTAWSNDAAYAEVFVEPLRNFLRAGDMLIAISTSGNSPNVVRAVEYANGQGALTVGFVGDRGGKLAAMAKLVVRVPSDHIGQQEDGHMILDHVIVHTLKQRLLAEGV